MKPRLTAWLLCPLAALASACGVPGGPPQPSGATYETFTLALEGATEGQELRPTEQVKLHVVYQGALARNLEVAVTITDVATGEVATERLVVTGESKAFDAHLVWTAQNRVFRKAGRFQVSFAASIVATLTGSTPWTTSPVGVVVSASPRIDSVVLSPLTVGAPTPYGTRLTITATGQELWGDVTFTMEDLGEHRAVNEFTRVEPGDGGTTTRVSVWSGAAYSVERVGVIPLQVTATFGQVSAKSEPFSVEIDHLVQAVSLSYRDADGVKHRPGANVTRLDTVKDIVLEVQGINLAGQLVRVNREAPFLAAADAFEIAVRPPEASAFPAGLGTHRFTYNVDTGGTVRGDHIDLRRWKLESCGWEMANGNPLPNPVPLGAQVVMRATGWGFPDTSGLLLFKKDQAEFLLWERDDGQNLSGTPKPFINNDDEVDWWKVDVMGSVAQKPWTTVFDEDFTVLGFGHAEYYFEVTLQDEKCTSGEISVPAK